MLFPPYQLRVTQTFMHEETRRSICGRTNFGTASTRSMRLLSSESSSCAIMLSSTLCTQTKYFPQNEIHRNQQFSHLQHVRQCVFEVVDDVRVFLVGQDEGARGSHSREANVLVSHVRQAVAQHLLDEVQVLTLL